MEKSHFGPITTEDIDFLRGTVVYHREYIEYGANLVWDKVTVLGWTPSGKRVRILDGDRERHVTLASLYQDTPLD